MKRYPLILLFSGGVDSFIAHRWLGRPPTLYFNLLTKDSKTEQATVKKLIPDTIIEDCLDLSSRVQGEKAYIPFRNLMLACLAVKYSDHIIMAGLKDDKVSDKNRGIFQEFERLLSKMEGRPILISSPFWDLTKSDIVRWYLECGGSAANLLNTFSCYSPLDSGAPCMACPACFRRWCAFWVNGIEMEFLNKDLLLDYLRRADTYIPERARDIKEAVNAHRDRY